MDPYQDVFRRQRSHHPNVKLTNAATRIAKLKKLKAALTKSAPKLREAIHADYGKSPAEVDITEIYPVHVEINHAIKQLGALDETEAGAHAQRATRNIE